MVWESAHLLRAQGDCAAGGLALTLGEILWLPTVGVERHVSLPTSDLPAPEAGDLQLWRGPEPLQWADARGGPLLYLLPFQPHSFSKEGVLLFSPFRKAYVCFSGVEPPTCF